MSEDPEPRSVPGEPEVDTESRRLAARLAQLRAQRGWSLQDLAQRTGVSRSTLSRAERGDISPTVATLGRLAAAYDRSIAALLAEVESEPRSLVRSAEQPVAQDESSGWRRRVVSPPYPGLRGQVTEAQIAPGADVTYDPPAPGAEQHLWLITGTMEFTELPSTTDDAAESSGSSAGEGAAEAVSAAFAAAESADDQSEGTQPKGTQSEGTQPERAQVERAPAGPAGAPGRRRGDGRASGAAAPAGSVAERAAAVLASTGAAARPAPGATGQPDEAHQGALHATTRPSNLDPHMVDPNAMVLVRGDCLRLRLWGSARLRCLSPEPARYALFTIPPND